MKLIKKHLFNGLAWGSMAFISNVVIFDLLGLEILAVIFENFSSSALGFLFVSIGFLTTGGIIYETKKIPFGLKLLIHIVIGIGTLLTVGFILNVFMFDDLSTIALNVIVNLLILLATWTYFYCRDKREVEAINANLREKRQQRKLDI